MFQQSQNGNLTNFNENSNLSHGRKRKERFSPNSSAKHSYRHSNRNLRKIFLFHNVLFFIIMAISNKFSTVMFPLFKY